MTLTSVSMNEFRSLLKRTFEGLGYCCGDYEDAAETGLWLERHDLQGLNSVYGAVARETTPLQSLEILSSSEYSYDLDANGCSVIVCGNKIVEFGVCKAVKAGRSDLRVKNCYEPIAIAAALSNSHQRDIGLLAHWQSDHNTFVATAIPGEAYPTLHQFDVENSDNSNASTLTLVCDRDVDNINALMSRIADGRPVNYDLAPREAMMTAAATAEENGLKVDFDIWGKLVTTANAILVESTERSRLGAGD